MNGEGGGNGLRFSEGAGGRAGAESATGQSDLGGAEENVSASAANSFLLAGSGGVDASTPMGNGRGRMFMMREGMGPGGGPGVGPGGGPGFEPGGGGGGFGGGGFGGGGLVAVRPGGGGAGGPGGGPGGGGIDLQHRKYFSRFPAKGDDFNGIFDVLYLPQVARHLF